MKMLTPFFLLLLIGCESETNTDETVVEKVKKAISPVIDTSSMERYQESKETVSADLDPYLRPEFEDALFTLNTDELEGLTGTEVIRKAKDKRLERLLADKQQLEASISNANARLSNRNALMDEMSSLAVISGAEISKNSLGSLYLTSDIESKAEYEIQAVKAAATLSVSGNETYKCNVNYKIGNRKKHAKPPSFENGLKPGSKVSSKGKLVCRPRITVTDGVTAEYQVTEIASMPYGEVVMKAPPATIGFGPSIENLTEKLEFLNKKIESLQE